MQTPYYKTTKHNTVFVFFLKKNEDFFKIIDYNVASKQKRPYLCNVKNKMTLLILIINTQNLDFMKKFIIALLAALTLGIFETVAFAATPNDNAGTYYGKKKHGKYEGYGVYVFNCGDKYEGNFSNGVFEGEGIYTYANGDTYVGEFKNGKQNGHGVAYYEKTGNIYEGNFINGAREGKGKFTWANGAEYEGDFVANARTGHGKLVASTGDIYVGDFKDGAYEGNGTLYKVNGRIYAGTWKANHITSLDYSALSIAE